MIAVDQDRLGIWADHWLQSGDLEIWFKPLDRGEFVFFLINRGLRTISFNQDLKTAISNQYTIDDSYRIRDLWNHTVIGNTSERLKGNLGPHDVLLIRLTSKSY